MELEKNNNPQERKAKKGTAWKIAVLVLTVIIIILLLLRGCCRERSDTPVGPTPTPPGPGIYYDPNAVRVTALTVTAENGWTLAPYNTNMATAKVDAKQIGFSLNGAKTTAAGVTEQLGLAGDWTISKGSSLPLLYDAVVSAMSTPVNEQVLTLVFVLDWAR